MSKRRMLYGYYIQQGEIAIVETEAIIVRRVFSFCIGGLSYQKISDLLNAEKIPYSQEMPVWNKHKIKRLLENPRYMGQDDTLPSLTEWGFRRHNHIFMKRRQGMHPELSGQYCD